MQMHPVIEWFAGFDISEVVHPKDPYYTLDEIQRPLETLKQTAKDALNSPEVWEELPQHYKESAVQELATMERVLKEIISHRKDAAWLASNAQGQINSVLNVYNTLYERFVSPVRAYKATSDAVQKETATALSRLQEAISEAEQSSIQAKSSAKAAGEAATSVAVTSLSEYFEHSVSGYPPEGLQKLKKKHPRTWWARNKYKRAVSNRNGYLRASRVWFVMVLLSIGVTAGISVWIFHGVDFATLTPQAVLAKALILAAPAYAIRFSVRNFNANKHLATTNRHRAIIMQTLLALLSRDEVSNEVREQIIVEATSRVFDPGESGYLTSRDALSGGDNVIQMPFSGK